VARENYKALMRLESGPIPNVKMLAFIRNKGLRDICGKKFCHQHLVGEWKITWRDKRTAPM